jgi:hypothetical protein
MDLYGTDLPMPGWELGFRTEQATSLSPLQSF